MVSPVKVGIFQQADPLGHVPSGIDTFIRSLVKWAPADLEYTVIGASSDIRQRPLGQEILLEFGESRTRFIPIISSDASAKRSRMPLTVQYIRELRRHLHGSVIRRLQVLDFHRIEPVLLFRSDPRPKNIYIHNDMAMARNKNSDIRWRYAPWLYEKLEAAVFRRVDRVLAVRQSAVDRYRSTFPLLAERFAFIPTCVDTSTFGPAAPEDRAALRARVRRELALAETAHIVIYVGRLDSQKDPLLLLKAFGMTASARPDLHLVVLGDGSLRRTIETAIAEAGLGGRVTLLGAKPASEIARLLQGSDLFVLSSAYEGMPIAVLEALAVGVPVVSTDVGEIRRVVKDGQSGYIARARTPEALATAIQRALADLPNITGAPCEAAVSCYNPRQVFSTIYENHRADGLRGSMNTRFRENK